MSKTAWAVLVVAGIGATALVVYFATQQRQASSTPFSGASGSASASGWVQTIGRGLVDTVAGITGAAEAAERAEQERETRATADSAGAS